MIARTCLISLILIASANPFQVSAQTPLSRPLDPAATFPREIDDGRFHIVVYQPQVESWQKNRLQGRAALSVSGEGLNREMFGIATLTARTDVDQESRTVWLNELQVSRVSFPGAEAEQHDVENAVRDSLPDWPRTIALDRLLAGLAINNAAAEPGSPLRNDPPRIISSQVPSVLIVIDGNPSMGPVAENPRYMRVVNTPALILYDTSASKYRWPSTMGP